MQIELIGKLEVVQSNPHSIHAYFGWPTAARLKNGRIAVGSSGFRLAHICPFGKAVLSFSENEGKTYTPPAVVIDTPLDDRDVGLCSFGKSSLILTSFNNTVEFQRNFHGAYSGAYLDTVTPEEVEKYYSSEFVISHDNGVTFGPIHHSPITSPHGPAELSDGTLLWVGRVFGKDHLLQEDAVQAYKVNIDGTMELLGIIENITEEGVRLLSCEPDITELDDGKILCHIRVQENGYFTVYQSESGNGGKTWTKPRGILSKQGGSPPELMRHSSGTVISTYGYRHSPFGIRAAFSSDGGNTWDTDNVIFDKGPSDDLGYPSTIELSDGSLLTVFYMRFPGKSDPAVIVQQKWRFVV